MPEKAKSKRKRKPTPRQLLALELATAEAILALPAMPGDFEARRAELAKQAVRLREYLS